MPYMYNGIKTVTQEELVPQFYSYANLRAILQRCKNKDYGMKSVLSGGNGRKLLVAFDSLPKHVQEGLKDHPVLKYDPYAF